MAVFDVPRDDPKLVKYHSHILAYFPNAEFVSYSDDDRLFFKPDPLLQHVKTIMKLHKISIEEFHDEIGKSISINDVMRYYAGTGFCLGGFDDLFEDDIKTALGEK
jgi:hypothetical protein